MDKLEVFAIVVVVAFLSVLAGEVIEQVRIEKSCLYTNRMELTKGRVMECRYMEGVTLK